MEKDSKAIFVSVIIPLYRQWDLLKKCLKSLAEQSYPKDCYEIIIINNDPNDIVPENLQLPENATMIVEQKPGSYAARNTGIKISKGEILAFTDSDCIPDKNWLLNAISYFKRNKSCNRIAGKVTVFTQNANPSLAEMYDIFYAFKQESHVSAGTCVTANMFTYKSIIEHIGNFDETLMSGGDYVWGTLAYNNGYNIHYVDDVIVKHPARLSLDELTKKEKRVGGGQSMFLPSSSNYIINLYKFIIEFRPRIREFKFVFNINSDYSYSVVDKIAVIYIRHFLLIIRAYEKFRVQCGKSPNRA